MMQDRPDLIQSELAGLAFDSLQQVFRKADIKIAMAIQPMPFEHNNTVFVVIDPVSLFLIIHEKVEEVGVAWLFIT